MKDLAHTWRCGSNSRQVKLRGDGAFVEIGALRVPLDRVLAESATQFEGRSKGTTHTLRVVERALLYRENAGAWTDCRVEEPTVRASGHEPTWQLTLAGSEAVLQRPGLSAPLRLEVRAVHHDPGSVTFLADGGQLQVRIHVAPALCRDPIRRLPFPQTVAIDLPDRQLRGCGGEPESLLRSSGWTLGDHKDAVRPPALVFTEPAGLLLHGACNRHEGHYSVSDEGLRLVFAGSTRIACAQDLEKLDQDLLQTLQQVRRFDIDDRGELQLIGPEGLLLKAQPSHRD